MHAQIIERVKLAEGLLAAKCDGLCVMTREERRVASLTVDENALYDQSRCEIYDVDIYVCVCLCVCVFVCVCVCVCWFGLIWM
jgi:hypothetical protein